MSRSTPPEPADIWAEDDPRLLRAESILGHRFKDRTLLRRALTHPACFPNGSISETYERLEFLGDSVLGLSIAEHTFLTLGDEPEGILSRVKTSVVRGSTLAAVARELGLVDCIAVPTDIDLSGRGGASAAENAFEAVTAALYLDAGFSAAKRFVLRALGHLVHPEAARPDAKSRLFEVAHLRGLDVEFEITDTQGPAHAREFTAQVRVGSRIRAVGSGPTKRAAQTAAAQLALDTLEKPRRRRASSPMIDSSGPNA